MDDLDDDGRPHCGDCESYHWPEPIQTCPEEEQSYIQPVRARIFQPARVYRTTVSGAVTGGLGIGIASDEMPTRNFVNLDAPLTPAQIGRLTAEDVRRVWAEQPDGDTL
jgi:hypothetical protein